MLVTEDQVSDAIIVLLDGQSDFFPFEFDDPSDINEGSCEDFALAVIAHLGYPENLTTGCANHDQFDLWGHVWLELKDGETTIYFDSEELDGVENPSQLPYFIRN